jgi:hypothetical protein
LRQELLLEFLFLLFISLLLLCVPYCFNLLELLFKVFFFHYVVRLGHKFNQFNSFCRVLLEHVFYKIFTFRGYGRCPWELHCLSLYLLHKITLVVRLERQGSVDHSEVHNANGPDVDGWRGVCCYFFKTLRSHVGQSSRINFFFSNAGNTEIDDLYEMVVLILILEQHVL